MSPNSIPRFAPLGWVSLLFSESDQSYVEVTEGTYFDGEFTVAAWVYVPHSFSTWTTIIDFGNGEQNDNVVMALSDGIPFMATFSGSQKSQMFADNNQPIPLDTWVHLAGSLDSEKTGRLFCNGRQVGTQSGMQVPGAVTRKSNYFGKSNWTEKSYCNAVMRDIGIWSKALGGKPDTQSSATNLSSGAWSSATKSLLIARWHCWEGYGAVAFNYATSADMPTQYGILGGGYSTREPQWVIASQPVPQPALVRPDVGQTPGWQIPWAPSQPATPAYLPTSSKPSADNSPVRNKPSADTSPAKSTAPASAAAKFDPGLQRMFAPWAGVESQDTTGSLLPMSVLRTSHSEPTGSVAPTNPSDQSQQAGAQPGDSPAQGESAQ